MLVDELIEIDLDLASIAVLPKFHRIFAVFFDLTTGDKQITITPSSLESDLKKIATDDTKSLIKLWFASGGNKLTIVNTKNDISEIDSIEAKNLIFDGNDINQQLAYYKKLPIELIKDKNLFFTVDNNTNLENYPKSRDVFFYLKGSNNSIFEYFAPYTQDKYYAKNNYKTSNLQGNKLTSLDYILQNNIGALVYFPEFKESKYLNIKDATGFNYNLDVLKDDIESDIKANLLTALSSNNLYNQANILRLENVLASTLDTYIDLNLILKYSTASLPYSKQAQIDIKNDILRGLKANYTVESEIQRTQVNLTEEV